MKPLVREGGWVSCTFSSSPLPKQLEKNDLKVVCLDSSKSLLTKYDTLIKNNFVCKSPIKFTFGAIGLGLGLILGAGLSIPVVGWIAIAVVAVIAVIAVIAALVISMNLCKSALKGLIWDNYHDSINYHGEAAIVYLHSTLECSNGGIIIASETLREAFTISSKMALNNVAEIGLHTLSQFGIGFLLGKFGPGSTAGIAVNMTLTAGLYVTGETVFNDNSAFQNSLGFLKIFSVDKYTYLFENIENPSFGGFFKGVTVSVAAMAIDWGSNQGEEWLENNNMEYIEQISNEGEIPIGSLQQDHYDRNKQNTFSNEEMSYNYYENIKEGEYNEDGWTLLTERNSIYHDNGDEYPEKKYVNRDGREIVFDGKTQQLVTDPNLEGTFNEVHPEGLKGQLLHGLKDILPYYLWGNSFKDDSTIFDRIKGKIPTNKNAKIYTQKY